MPNPAQSRKVLDLSPFEKFKLLAARTITNYWGWVLGFWVCAVVVLRLVAPSWNSIAQDGDFKFLPGDLPSRIGQQWLEEGFPDHRARSQLVIVLANRKQPLRKIDLALSYDLARQLMHKTAVVSFYRQLRGTKSTHKSAGEPVGAMEDDDAWENVRTLFDSCIALDQKWFEAVRKAIPPESELPADRLADAHWYRAELLSRMELTNEAEADRQTALLLDPSVEKLPRIEELENDPWLHALDLWTWEDDVVGSKLGSKNANAKMLLMQLESEFIAVSNIALIQALDELISSTKARYEKHFEGNPTEIGTSGSAAVGGDMLRASAFAVQQTEWVTVLMILLILAIVYRGPLLVAIPLFTIGLSLVVSLSVIALLAEVPDSGVRSGFRVFSTTRIFIVVLLFGAGTDFCLFFLARCREALTENPKANRRNVQRMVASSWRGVLNALTLSALTTMIGLGLMYFSKFEKFQHSGPIIAICLGITLVVCLTFTPALICALGHRAFWPLLSPKNLQRAGHRPMDWFWKRLAEVVVRRPIPTFAVCLLLLLIPAVQGWVHRGWITYDFTHELDSNSPSRRGTAMIVRYFPTSDASPLTVMVSRNEPFENEKALRAAIDPLREALYVDGVLGVRTLTDPLGDFPPDRRMALFGQDSWRRRLLEGHKRTQKLFVATQPTFVRRMVRLDLIIAPNPFSTEAEDVLARVREKMSQIVQSPDSEWHGAEFAFAGTTPGIHDLKVVTQADQRRIQLLVALGVWAVLFLMLRRVWVSGYLIFTVLLSYLTTLGLTQWFFQWCYQDEFVGLDWKVPLFLFVILVAVGQDYNVYLTTRVIEEQKKHGPIGGLIRALVLTGGIITSCGVVMAATFLSMTSGAIIPKLQQLASPWLATQSEPFPILRGIVELGFALALGVLIDTFLVRTILVPSMFAIQTRIQKRI